MGAVLREQNALPYALRKKRDFWQRTTLITSERGVPAKGTNPPSSSKNKVNRFRLAPQKLEKILKVHIFMKERKRMNQKYSPEFKIFVIMYMRNNHLG